MALSETPSVKPGIGSTVNPSLPDTVVEAALSLDAAVVVASGTADVRSVRTGIGRPVELSLSEIDAEVMLALEVPVAAASLPDDDDSPWVRFGIGRAVASSLAENEVEAALSLVVPVIGASVDGAPSVDANGRTVIPSLPLTLVEVALSPDAVTEAWSVPATRD